MNFNECPLVHAFIVDCRLQTVLWTKADRGKLKQGRIHGNPVADGWAGAVMQKPIAIQKCDGPTDRRTDGWTYWPTDTARCRVTCPRLKKSEANKLQGQIRATLKLPCEYQINAFINRKNIIHTKQVIATWIGLYLWYNCLIVELVIELYIKARRLIEDFMIISVIAWINLKEQQKHKTRLYTQLPKSHAGG